MPGGLVMRCGVEDVTIVGIGQNSAISSIEQYPVGQDKETDDLEGWLAAFEESVAKVPKRTRTKISFVIPPNKSVFVKHVSIPDVTEGGVDEAFKFECESVLPGGSSEWKWDIYRPNGSSRHAFVFGMRVNFAERFVDILLRNNVQFSNICPEIILNNIAVEKFAACKSDIMIMCVDEAMSYLTCIGNGESYLRMVQVSGHGLSRTISNAQHITMADADDLQKKFEENSDDESKTFMSYYIKQFSQLVRQEMKKSELFYCRTFKQPPINTVYMTGNKCKLCHIIEPENCGNEIDLFDVLRDRVGSGISEDDISLIRGTIGCFIGASIFLSKKNGSFLQILSSEFTSQVEFQKKNFVFVLLLLICAILFLAVEAKLKNDVKVLDAKISKLKERVEEAEADAISYNEMLKEEKKLKTFVKNSRAALKSQAAFSELMNELQAKVAALDTAWIESFHWSDKAKSKTDDTITVGAKMLILDGRPIEAAGKSIEKFVESLKDSAMISDVSSPQIGNVSDDSIEFSFDLTLDKESDMIAL